MILQQIQSELKAPKSQRNDFGKYNYRSCEDILEAVKPVLAKYESAITISDELVLIGERYYIKATATLITKDGIFTSTAYAREEESKKGMDASQLTGSTSSYARKYALNGLLAIDDTKDSDATNKGDREAKPTQEQLNKVAELGIQLADLKKYFRLNENEDLTASQVAEGIALKEKALARAKKTEVKNEN